MAIWKRRTAKGNNGEFSDVSTDNSSSSKYKSYFIGTIPNGGRKNEVKIAVPFEYLIDVTFK